MNNMENNKGLGASLNMRTVFAFGIGFVFPYVAGLVGMMLIYSRIHFLDIVATVLFAPFLYATAFLVSMIGVPNDPTFGFIIATVFGVLGSGLIWGVIFAAVFRLWCVLTKKEK